MAPCAALGVILSIIIENLHKTCAQDDKKPKYWIPKNEHIYRLSQMCSVLGRMGYKRTTNETPWDLLLTEKYPYIKMNLRSLKPHQRVNHIPDGAVIYYKVDFATRFGSENIPKAFRLPKDKDEFLKYASKNKRALFVEKGNNHSGVKLKNVTDVDLGGKSFVQEFIQNPFLVENYKFDIGVFVAITSVDPLRMYHYNGDVFIRFCPDQYYPFNSRNVNKYVIAHDYRPMWKVPVLKQMLWLGYGMRDSLNFYLRSKGKDPRKVWADVYNALRDNLVNKAQHGFKNTKEFAYPSNFFQLLRVDLILDENMKVHLLEANSEPTLVSVFASLRLLNDQVLYNLYNLVGLGSPIRKYHSDYAQLKCGNRTRNENYESCVENKTGALMLATNKNIGVWASDCANLCKGICDGICSLCLECPNKDKLAFIEAYREHLRKSDFRRLFPPPMTPNNASFKTWFTSKKVLRGMSSQNRLMYLWYQGKCNEDPAWCN